MRRIAVSAEPRRGLGGAARAWSRTDRRRRSSRDRPDRARRGASPCRRRPAHASRIRWPARGAATQRHPLRARRPGPSTGPAWNDGLRAGSPSPSIAKRLRRGRARRRPRAAVTPAACSELLDQLVARGAQRRSRGRPAAPAVAKPRRSRALAERGLARGDQLVEDPRAAASARPRDPLAPRSGSAGSRPDRELAQHGVREPRELGPARGRAAAATASSTAAYGWDSIEEQQLVCGDAQRDHRPCTGVRLQVGMCARARGRRALRWRSTPYTSSDASRRSRSSRPRAGELAVERRRRPRADRARSARARAAPARARSPPRGARRHPVGPASSAGRVRRRRPRCRGPRRTRRRPSACGPAAWSSRIAITPPVPHATRSPAALSIARPSPAPAPRGRRR